MVLTSQKPGLDARMAPVAVLACDLQLVLMTSTIGSLGQLKSAWKPLLKLFSAKTRRAGVK